MLSFFLLSFGSFEEMVAIVEGSFLSGHAAQAFCFFFFVFVGSNFFNTREENSNSCLSTDTFLLYLFKKKNQNLQMKAGEKRSGSFRRVLVDHSAEERSCSLGGRMLIVLVMRHEMFRFKKPTHEMLVSERERCGKETLYLFQRFSCHCESSGSVTC